jgi:hypothetical protein
MEIRLLFFCSNAELQVIEMRFGKLIKEILVNILIFFHIKIINISLLHLLLLQGMKLDYLSTFY